MAQVVERFVRDEEAASSSLVTPIIRKNLERSRFFCFTLKLPKKIRRDQRRQAVRAADLCVHNIRHGHLIILL